MLRWYAAQCHSHKELWARSSLWQRGFDVYLPQYRKLRRHARRREWVARPLFPGYLFVRADPGAGHWKSINTAPGVATIIRFGRFVPPVADEVIAEIRAREGDDGLVDLDEAGTYRTDEPLRICHGPLGELVGLFKEVRDDRRIILFLNMLGRMVPVNVEQRIVSR